jgi:hypothetical protein
MQSTLLMNEPKKRRSRGKRDITAITYRLTPAVKNCVAEVADVVGRSENLQVEFFIKVGYLYSKGINIYGMNESQIAQKFDEISTHLKEENEQA